MINFAVQLIFERQEVMARQMFINTSANLIASNDKVHLTRAMKDCPLPGLTKHPANPSPLIPHCWNLAEA